MTVMVERPATRSIPLSSSDPRRAVLGLCVSDPDRWALGGDDPELKALCRGCPRRYLCAADALATPAIEGMVASVWIPSEGRGRRFALRQLQSLAAHAGLADQPVI